MSYFELVSPFFMPSIPQASTKEAETQPAPRAYSCEEGIAETIRQLAIAEGEFYDNEALNWSPCGHGSECRRQACQYEYLQELYEETEMEYL